MIHLIHLVEVFKNISEHKLSKDYVILSNPLTNFNYNSHCYGNKKTKFGSIDSFNGKESLALCEKLGWTKEHGIAEAKVICEDS